MAAKSVKALGLALKDSSGLFSPFNFSRRATGEHDVQLKVLYCGVCNFDNLMRRNKYGRTKFPYVFGHEIVGVVTEVGSNVKKFKIGNKVGVSFIVDTCRECERCKIGQQIACKKAVSSDGFFETPGYGGCSNIFVADENYVILWPENLPMDSGAPLLCIGITCYNPLRRFGLDKPGVRVGIVGLGAVGHLAIKFAKAFGARVTLISSSPGKKDEAFQKFGVDSFLVSSNAEEMQAAAETLDGILDTVPVVHPLEPLFALLKPLGKLIIIGEPHKPFEVSAMSLMEGGKIISASTGGSIKDTQEIVDFAAEHNVVADVEVIPVDYVNTAMERLDKADVKYRFVIDIGNTFKSP
nr:tabersonine 3-reductase [Catharanthus roseus]